MTASLQGKQIGSYELITLLGKGGMGEVWQARHQMLSRLTALKLISPEALGSKTAAAAMTMMRRFEREAKATSALRSPHTVEIYDFGITPDGCFYYAMELLEGLNLRELLEQYGPIPAERATNLMIQVCESLAEAHHAGLIHRDIKPANLFLCKLGLVHDFIKVLDFGLVKLGPESAQDESQLTVEGVAAGSPAFMSPEVAKGMRTIDGRADLYSLGCVAYWLMSGQLVFEGDSSIQIVLAHVNEAPPRLSRRTSNSIPAELEQLVMQCLAKNPEERPASAKELAKQLSALRYPDPWSEDRAERWWTYEGKGILSRPREVSLAETVDSLEAKAGGSPAATPPMFRRKAVESTPELVQARARAVESLQEQFAHSRISDGEYERRVELVEYARSPQEVDEVVADLLGTPPGVDRALIPRSPQADASDLPAGGSRVPDSRALVPLDAQQPDRQLAKPTSHRTFLAFMSAVVRRGVWNPPRSMKVIAFMGGAELDLRHAVLEPGCTTLNFMCVMGGAQITVPPDLYVQVDGSAIMGGFEHKGAGATRPPTEGQPWLRITGFCFMGGVEVRVKPSSMDDDETPHGRRRDRQLT